MDSTNIKQQKLFRMISEGSCDSEDWSNDAKKLHFKMY